MSSHCSNHCASRRSKESGGSLAPDDRSTERKDHCCGDRRPWRIATFSSGISKLAESRCAVAKETSRQRTTEGEKRNIVPIARARRKPRSPWGARSPGGREIGRQLATGATYFGNRVVVRGSCGEKRSAKASETACGPIEISDSARKCSGNDIQFSASLFRRTQICNIARTPPENCDYRPGVLIRPREISIFLV